GFIAPAGVPSPLLWGDEATVRERFGEAVARLQLNRVQYRFDYPFSPDGVVDFFRDYYGPANRAFPSLTQANHTPLPPTPADLWSGGNQSRGPERTVVSEEYLEVLATRS